MSFLSQLEWRHATKNFDPNKKVSEPDLTKLKEAIQLSPTSFGLQPFHVKIIENEALKAKIKPHAWDQAQISDCSHLLVFCVRNDVVDRIDQYFEIATGGDQTIREKMAGYEQLMRGALEPRTHADLENWAIRQVYIAHGFALAACAELEIDSCPIEGFVPAEADKILEFPEHIKSVVLMPIGYRAEDPKHEKVRFSESDLFS